MSSAKLDLTSIGVASKAQLDLVQTIDLAGQGTTPRAWSLPRILYPQSLALAVFYFVWQSPPPTQDAFLQRDLTCHGLADNACRRLFKARRRAALNMLVTDTAFRHGLEDHINGLLCCWSACGPVWRQLCHRTPRSSSSGSQLSSAGHPVIVAGLH